MIELERTFLAKYIPPLGLGKEMIDIYLPAAADHPVLRIRKNGEKFEMTKKYPVNEGDSSTMHEFTIPLTAEEFAELSMLDGKRVCKTRHTIMWNDFPGEVDIFTGALKGLVLVDFEFTTQKEKEAFIIPEFCLTEITQEKFVAGGMVCGKKYEDLEANLNRFNYQKL